MTEYSKPTRQKVVVVGGGVVGLSCALVLSRDYQVHVVAEKMGILSDSRKATAIWHVYLVPETTEVLSWSQRSLEVLCEMAEISPESGVELVEGVELFRRGSPSTPKWSHIPRMFRPLAQEEVALYNSLSDDSVDPADRALLRAWPVLWGYRIEAPAANMQIYLPWLERSVRANGVTLETRRITSLDDVANDCSFVVNCSGFGARELAQDRAFVPYKGQYFVLRDSAGSPRTYIGDDDHPRGMAYVIPRFGELLVGGCAEEGIESLELTLDWDDTMKRAGLYCPWLMERSQADQARPPVVGIRPCRKSGVRLEVEMGDHPVPVVHNYGHGGSGFSLSWGCAEAVRDVLLQL
jgi:D-amino-acid oxidase